ncbi:hypothetical protein ACT8ZV_07370 [Nocardioides sp. MAHUQ-72]|uniref:hypothetical protein n=1 Tax=unclassified Nocardioides TaxID=2615069 RepID=UPI0036183DAF
MRNPDEFDAFYKDARDRLLLQTYALTGDLPASRAAVRDSFVVAWHHWRKISRMDDPEAWARPHAWAHAQRRHTARLWHRDKGLDPEDRATLDALGKLSVNQRKALLLTQLATVSMGQMAREVGLPRHDAERELQTATAQFAVHRDVPSTGIRPLFESLRAHLGDGRWPRPTIIRRAGAARRRTHTAVGAIAAVAAVVVTGILVTDAAGVRPTLGRDHVVNATASRQPAARPEPSPEALPETALLTSAQVADDIAGNRWAEGPTTGNTGGDGLVLPCQQARYADPRGAAALVRTFTARPSRGNDGSQAFQTAEVSTSGKAARRTFDRTLGWYAGCTDRRVQLLSTHEVTGVGDEASLVVLRSWKEPTTMVVGVARTGMVTTTTLARVPGTGAPAVTRSAQLLSAAVEGLCDLPDSGACSGRPRVRTAAPVPVGQVPGMIGEVDLPPVAGIARPWVGTEPRRAMTNIAATRCDEADFSGAGITNNLTRSFLVPGAKVPDEFGLTETVGSMPAPRAHAFVERVRSRLAACQDKDLGTDVTRLAQASTRTTDLTVWRVTTEISDQSSVVFFMGIARSGTSVAQVGFVPAGRFTMAPGAFPALVRRALDRLPAMPPPASGG